MQGYRRTLQYEDVFDTPAALKTKEVYPGFATCLQNIVESADDRVRDQAKDGKIARFLALSIWRQHKHRLLFAMLLQLTYSGVQFVGPLMLNQIVSILTTSDVLNRQGLDLDQSEITRAFLFAMGMLLAPMVGALGAAQANRVSIGTQVMIRSELTASIYRKALRMSTRSRQATETGRIVNLMSADVNQLQSFFYPFASQILTGPVVLITALILLWFQIRWATFIGLGILLISTPATTIFLKKITQYRRQMLKQTDQRVKLMNQLLVGIRVLKMYAWEAAQEAALLEVRKKELRELGKAVPMRVGMQTLLFAAPTLAMVTCFVAYGAAAPEDFTPANIFTAISLFALMRFPLIFLPFALVQLANALVSMRRLTQYFMLDERDDDLVEEGEAPGIEIRDGNFYWAEPPPKLVMPEITKKKKGKKNKKKQAEDDEAKRSKIQDEKPSGQNGTVQHEDVKLNGTNDSPKLTDGKEHKDVETGSLQDAGEKRSSKDVSLINGEVAVSLPSVADKEELKEKRNDKGVAWRLQNINLQIRPGDLVCVVGRVGSGKSSLIQAVLGEMEKQSGSVIVGGKVAYAAQQAWIINATVKENVSFGKPFDEERWEHCVDACCLASDLDVLPAGADTEIGEKGINLSGGQKQRVALARALYQNADVYILDDPLSAVDVHVGKHIFDRFIDGAIKDKARLLVTNQLQYLPAADHIITLEDGKVVAQGTYEECMESESFARLLTEHNSQVGRAEAASEDVEEDLPTAVRRSLDAHRPVKDSDSLQRREMTDAYTQVPGALGRPGVLDAKLARSATFVKIDDQPSVMMHGKSFQDPKEREKALKIQSRANYGAQLERFETMRYQASQARKASAATDLQGDETKAVKSGSLIVKEDQEVGHVTGRVYLRYIMAYGWISFIALVLFWSSEQTVRILTNWFLSRWTSEEVEASAKRAAGNVTSLVF